VVTLFGLWMFVHAARQGEWIWAIFILFGWGIAPFVYFITTYRTSGGDGAGFELPGTASRARIRELKGQIHHLDHAYHHYRLGDVYFNKGKFTDAEQCYREALKREPDDLDARAHLGQCLMRLKRPEEARPLLEAVCRENYKHDFGFSLMAYAESLTALGEKDAAYDIWKHVVENHAYARAKVQFAELCLQRHETDLARTHLKEIVTEDAHAPGFQRRRDRVWVRRAKALLAGVGKG
jgi:hypothetical protein